MWVAWLIAVCKWEEACSRSPSGSNPIHWSWLLCLSYHTSSENHDDKAVPLSWAGHRLLNPHKAVEEPRLKFSTRLCRFRILVLVRVIWNFYHGTWHYFKKKYVLWYPRVPVCVCMVFFPILWGCHTDNHPQGDLAMVGYRPAMEVEIY